MSRREGISPDFSNTLTRRESIDVSGRRVVGRA